MSDPTDSSNSTPTTPATPDPAAAPTASTPTATDSTATPSTPTTSTASTAPQTPVTPSTSTTPAASAEPPEKPVTRASAPPQPPTVGVGPQPLPQPYIELMAGALPGLMAQMPIAAESTTQWREYVGLLAQRAAQIADACLQAADKVWKDGDVDWGDIAFGDYPSRKEMQPMPPPTRRPLGSYSACKACGAKAWRALGPDYVGCGVCGAQASRYVSPEASVPVATPTTGG